MILGHQVHILLLSDMSVSRSSNHLAASLVFRIGMKGGGKGGVNLGRFVGN